MEDGACSGTGELSRGLISGRGEAGVYPGRHVSRSGTGLGRGAAARPCYRRCH